MKGSIQMYGIIITFALFLFIIPQILALGLLYREINSLASYIVEIIEVHEGIRDTNGAIESINEKLSKYPSLTCKFEKSDANTFYLYQVDCFKKVKISILNIPVELHAKKQTRRVIY